ncbi:MAG: SRPBCC domain-containing protein [Archangium sp.]|nr:SRPBCC domain-containing protein [Archangium sp.]
MKRLLLFALLLTSACTTVRQLKDPATLTPDGKASRTRTADALDYSIAITIAAPPEVVWAVLTDASGFTRWNSTLTKLEGEIARDKKVSLVSKVAPDRTFTLTVSEFEANKKMVWEDGNGMFLGVRHFTLLPSEGGTVVAMSETYSGLFLGSAEAKMPDFTQNFETFAADLKKEAERKASGQ